MTLFLLLALAADPKIEVAAETPVYVPVQIKVTGTSAKSTSLIEVDAAAWERKTGKHSSEVTGKPGTYTATAIYIENDKDGVPSVVKLKASFKIVGEGPKPPPDDPVDPPKPPTPNTPSKIWIVVVEETEAAAINRGAMFGDPALNAYMQSKGHSWRIVDKDVKGVDGQPPADIKRFLDRAKGKQFPAIFFVDEKGRTRGENTMSPTDTAANVIESLKLYDGSK